MNSRSQGCFGTRAGAYPQLRAVARPMVERVCRVLSEVEPRHGGAYLRYMKKYLAELGDSACRLCQDRRADGQCQAHRQGAAPDQPARERGALPARHRAKPPARPGVAGALAGRADQVRRRVGDQGGRAHPAQHEPALRAQLCQRAGVEPVSEGSQCEVGASGGWRGLRTDSAARDGSTS
jgi:hypothetical protein